ncbi:MAG: NfeD family protein [Armatimonadota bacterium]
MTGIAYAYVAAIVGGVLFAIASGFLGEILGHFGGDGLDVDVGHDVDVHVGGDGFDVHADGIDAHAEVGGVGDVAHLSPVSPPVIATLVTTFGVVGLVCENVFGLGPLLSLPIAVVSSVALAALVFATVGRLLVAVQSTSHAALADLAGTEAQVITPIPADGVGEVSYSYANVRESRPARSEDGVLIPKHALVRISRVAGSTLIVRELVDERLRRLHDADADAEAGEEPSASQEAEES